MSNVTYRLDSKTLFKSDVFKFEQTSRSQRNKIRIKLNLPFKSDRKIIEDFIHKGFKRHYNANIQHFLPNLFSIGSATKPISALGFRSASTRELFFEQYLERNIESYFNQQGIKREQIGEIGNLYGTNRRMTLQLFVISVVCFHKSGFKKLVFCATPQVQEMFQQFSVSRQYIAKANPEKLGSQIKHWGSYYQSDPKLVAIDIDEVINTIEQSKVLSRIAIKAQTQLLQLVENLIN